jgi:hypothetical protein
MKTKLRSTSTLALALGLATAFTGAYARADILTGTIDIQGNANTQNASNTAPNQLAVATHYTSITALVDAAGDTGSFVSIPNNTPVTFTPFAFNALGVYPLWTLTTGGHTYSYDATSTALTYQNAGFINLSGLGDIYLDGTDGTAGTWSLTDTIQAKTVTFSYVSTSNVPDAGSTFALIAMGAVGIGVWALVRSRRPAPVQAAA